MILHVDMDAFYASVEERENTSLLGRPVVVGGSPEGRGVVAAANYEARKYGIHSAMPAAVAKRLCPNAIFLPTRISFYSRVSDELRLIFGRYTPVVEPLSLDEAFLDVTSSGRLFGHPAEIGKCIKRDIASELGLIASVGVAPSKFIAKLASDVEKPDGFVVVYPGEEQTFLDPLPVGCIWGIGRSSGEVFERLGVKTIKGLRGLRPEILKSHFGRHGDHLWELAHGRDNRKVIADHEAKSISHETTFVKDLKNETELRAWLLDLTEQVGRRLRRLRLGADTVQVKIRFGDFQTITRARSLPKQTHALDLWEVAADLLHGCIVRDSRPVRLVGIGVSGLQKLDSIQGDLFDHKSQLKQSQLDSVVDSIVDRFGRNALRRGSNPRS